ncbi:MAG: ATP synthase F1 subunit gamma [Pirellulales bacterium]|nr:ATP synthase F1 subunit gamma [Pirellulales bacterium]
MAKARALDKRRKSIRNIRKITRTMELIATAKFKKAMDRAHAATAYTRRITAIVSDLAQSGLEVSHPLLQGREEIRSATLLVLTANRGLCGGYNGNVQRVALARWNEFQRDIPEHRLEVSGKRGISFFRFRGITPDATYTQFEDRPAYEEAEALAEKYLEAYVTGKLDRLDVAYTRFHNVARQEAVVETLLPLGSLSGGESKEHAAGQTMYEFLPSAESILEEVVPTSFKVRLFKCLLDAAVSEQVARMVAMKAATDNANNIIKYLTRTYNRARQSQITNEIMEVLGGVEALKG